jgi:hypothetical protein
MKLGSSPSFGIDLHIDDDISVKQNGIQYGFNVLIVNKNDEDWDYKVLNEANRIIKIKGKAYSVWALMPFILNTIGIIDAQIN